MNTLLTCVVAAVVALPMGQGQIVRVEVNGVPGTYDGTPPQIRDGRVLVPVRSVFEQLGATVTWDDEKKVVTAEKEGRHIWMRIGETTALRNDVPVILDVAPQIIEGSTLIPLRFISEALGAKVVWNGIEKLVVITTEPPPALLP
ncbi:MAG: copper amine oxidase N-terminal domain-containing protein [Fimbriimonadaceae bacterium]|nr:copper amine oxidase N-terminal domain-containing protein [Fimbriimonadaceae bacterium]